MAKTAKRKLNDQKPNDQTQVKDLNSKTAKNVSSSIHKKLKRGNFPSSAVGTTANNNALPITENELANDQAGNLQKHYQTCNQSKKIAIMNEIPMHNAKCIPNVIISEPQTSNRTVISNDDGVRITVDPMEDEQFGPSTDYEDDQEDPIPSCFSDDDQDEQQADEQYLGNHNYDEYDQDDNVFEVDSVVQFNLSKQHKQQGSIHCHNFILDTNDVDSQQRGPEQGEEEAMCLLASNPHLGNIFKRMIQEGIQEETKKLVGHPIEKGNQNVVPQVLNQSNDRGTPQANNRPTMQLVKSPSDMTIYAPALARQDTDD